MSVRNFCGFLYKWGNVCCCRKSCGRNFAKKKHIEKRFDTDAADSREEKGEQIKSVEIYPSSSMGCVENCAYTEQLCERCDVV